ncbi:MAG: DUF4105 domain-containing protein [Gammaproteobacteria bacterium]|nr:DUF4105 domain-containing protein [Gammaproteobacteria bacterium]MBT8150381.1 DUF4105 domain-containing protein [Gammaproteobacteria bacterium]NND38479.1 DUF4105 domain-containing protein [Pseudomonadales bacterium]NNM11563.1 DUF4105 domain-containing protein [Pseudomonadales bacterium]RZV60200.1 MAG: DUF4105 domain-containing protein [Pseudomonadales bacterium]
MLLNRAALILLLIFSARSWPLLAEAPVAIENQNAAAGLNDTLQPDFEALAANRQWLHLLHYHDTGLPDRPQSQVDTTAFFLSPVGKRNPIAELQATYYGLLADKSRSDGSVYCRYPARVKWLSQHLPVIAALDGRCNAQAGWLAQIDAEKLTVVFPAAYLNSPSSMYGHTLIRVNKTQCGNPLLDYVVNFAANTPPADNEIVFAWKGLTGGYPGVVSILPYYEKINDYSFLESRDIWEYELKLEDEEVKQFLRHIWELRGSEFGYYFLTENCSYQLLALLDAASDRLNLTEQFRVRAIPSDTVRALFNAGIVAQTRYRPSVLTQMRSKYAVLSSGQARVAARIVKPGEVANQLLADALPEMPEKQAAQVLEVAYDFGRFSAMKGKKNDPLASAHSIRLLTARSALMPGRLFPEPPIPAWRDDQGHPTRRLSVGVGNDGQRDFQSLALRMAFHDALDPPQGYLPFASLEMLSLELRNLHEHSLRSSELQLHEIKLINISSLSPGNTMLQPTSWRVGTGARRHYTGGSLAPFLDLGFGRAKLALSNQRLLAYGFVDAALDVGKSLRDGYQLALGPALGLLHQTGQWSSRLEARYRASDRGSSRDEQALEFSLALHILGDHTPGQQLRYRAQYRKDITQDDISHELGWQWYF